MTAPLPGRRPVGGNAIITVVFVTVTVLAGVLIWMQSNAQTGLTTLRSGQTTGQAQRTDQQQLTCALWAILRDDNAKRLGAAMRRAADKICANAPTPGPSSSATP
ncbi:hypothetical protein AB0G60_02450 [Streptomyces angustmyceticus]|uniref:Uncharacterized protein n=1 Tax=Streptomyces angustmyceticus TaxID=285578 RepID=A0A5J4LBE0_9ACTN|nr:hypothetical protein [Streptomyces angustmyceticus]UAL65523.1 hypothetical protein K7396_02425 [Streptomyces angustmyceticus]GES27958.1 hypothetical protein San01_04450 [Streptomyces angustmyceticus]